MKISLFLLTSLLLSSTVNRAQPFLFSKKKLTMYVASERQMCTGEMPMNCLRIKWKESDAWELFYGEIEGFSHEEGYEYELKVHREKAKNPPADASAYRYKLVKVIAKSKDQREEPPKAVKGGLSLSEQWIIHFFMQDGKQVPPKHKNSYFTINEDLTYVQGFAGCNNFGGAVIVGGNTLKFGPMMVTKKYCEGLMEQETQFLDAMNNVDNFIIEGGELLLKKGELVVMRMESFRK